ncbi:MAG TPA: DUF3488 and transglutaminase-like domain-containing protein, partial [Opitutaceae bacterium]
MKQDAEPKRTRPQLTLEELHQLKWLLGTALAVLSAWTLFFMEVDAWAHLGLITLASVAAIVRPAWPASLPAWAHRLAFPLFVSLFAYDLYVHREPLPALIRLDLMLLLYRVVTHRKRRDDLQVIVLGLFLVILAGVLTVSLAFAVQILAFTACALAFLLLITLTDAAEVGLASTTPPAPGVPPHWTHVHWRTLFGRVRAVTDWRILLFGGLLFAGVVAVSGLLFLAIPRFELNNSLFIDRLINRKTRTGFSDSVQFGEVTRIQQDTSIALNVDVSDPNRVPASPYWRMIVLDEYSRDGFRMSARFRNELQNHNRTTGIVPPMYVPRRGRLATDWTFYLEPGVSRFLPLLGGFTALHFTEAQTVGRSPALRVVALRNDPPKMLAYRARSMDAAESVPDPDFADRRLAPDPTQPDFTALPFGAADLARLRDVVTEIAGDAPRNAADFAARASAWLARHHAYSLSSTLPPGEADPLVRWLTSDTPGHCEYFAGSLVVLARRAGLPARLVVGFKGGTWNGYSNSFTVRNSHAHAWAEVFDDHSRAWLRVDPTPGGTTTTSGGADNGEDALQRLIDRSWNARIESLRVFWYRRIVSFDRSAQVKLTDSARDAIESTGRRLRERLDAWAEAVKAWLERPWDAGRWLGIAGGALAVAAAAL